MKLNKKKFLIVTTVPSSLFFFIGQVGILKKEFDIEVITGQGKRFDEFCDSQSVVGHRIKHMKREISLFSDVLSLFKLIKMFRLINPEVVHGNTPKGGLLSMIAAWFVGIPVRIYCVHGLRYQGENGFKRKLLMFFEKISCRLATHVFTVSFGVKKKLKTDGIYNKESHIIWNGSVNGIDKDHFSSDKVNVDHLKEEYKLNKNHFVFGFIGRLVKDKGINELVEVFVKLNKMNDKTRLLLVGGYGVQNSINDSTKSIIENHKNIIYCGLQNDVRPFLKLMDVFTFPSYREGFGISLMEAAAMNLPAISSNIIGCNEIIKDGFNGKLIESKNSNALELAMDYFMSNPKIAKQMSSVTRQYVIDKYDKNVLWEKALDKYKKIVEDV